MAAPSQGQAAEARNSGKRSFGSFHSSNVEELITLPEEEYQPPIIPVELPVFTEHTQFGQKTKDTHFLLDDSWTFINHGAFGAVLKQALTATSAWQLYCERQPLRFLDRELLPLLVYTTRQLANFIDSAPRDVVLIPNVTTGINIVINSVCQDYSTENTVLFFNTTYGAVKKVINKVSSERGFSAHELILQFPLKSNSQIMAVLEAGLRQYNSVKLVVIDHISSNYGIVFPVKDMVNLCHSRGVQVLVDGAHALGSLPISMRDIGADYYVSNAHKWLCNPKGCAFLYVDRLHQTKVRPLVVSHGYHSGFNSSFIWSGLRDYSPFLALNTVLSFWIHYGADHIRQYIHSTARKAGESLVAAWGTHLLADTTIFGPMVVVALPDVAIVKRIGPGGVASSDLTYDHAETVQNTLYHQYHIEVPVKAIQGKLYVRISAHIYNTPNDYEKLATAVVAMTTSTDTT